MTRFFSAIFFVLAVTALRLEAQTEPQGVVVYQAPATTYTEVMEFRSFRQDNALYATLVTAGGVRKQFKAGGVLAVVPYPPATFGADSANTAQTTLDKIDALVQEHPAIKAAMGPVRARWDRAANVFRQMEQKNTDAQQAEAARAKVLTVKEGKFESARITSATEETVTVAHSAGVTTLPIAELTAPQILLLNRSSDGVQLPLRIARPSSATAMTESALTLRIAAVGQGVVESIAHRLNQDPKTVTIWSLFVILPGLVILLLIGLVLSDRNPVRKLKPK